MRGRIWRGLLGLLVSIGTSGAQAGCPARPIVVAHFEFGHYFHAGTGLEADLVSALKRLSGCAFDERTYPRARTWLELENGRVDMALTVIDAPERERIGWFLPYQQARNFVLTQAELPSGIDGQAAFLKAPTLRWATVRGFRHGSAYDDFVAELARQGRLDTVNTSLIAFDMLRLGRVAGVLASPMVYRFEIDANAMAGLHVLDWAPHSKPILTGLLLSRASFTESDAHYWQDLLDTLRRDGTLLQLFERYLPPEEARAHQLP
jgi:polar amino acid transport system substrate-binding protein